MAERPDARLLLPAPKVRRVPEGARVWHARDEYHPGVVVGVTLDGRIMVRWVGGRECAHGADRLLLDLSAPADGERVDLLPWARGESGIDRVTVESPTSAIVRFRDEARDAGGRFRGMVGIGATVADLVALGELDTAPTIPGLDLTGLSDADAARAVVVAKLGVARG